MSIALYIGVWNQSIIQLKLNYFARLNFKWKYLLIRSTYQHIILMDILILVKKILLNGM